MTLIVLGLCLISHMVVHGTVITINNNGSDSVNCCTSRNCPCSSLSSALHFIQSNTLINIISKSLTLYDIVEMGSGRNTSYLTNIKIIGNGVTIMCNNTGGVSCESCSDIIIRGITWYQCGRNDPMHPTTNIPALNFTTISNMTIHNCTFQCSSGCPLFTGHASGNITINESYFMANIFEASGHGYGCAGVHIFSERDNSISIYSSVFHSNGCSMSDTTDGCNHYAVYISLVQYDELLSVVIDSTEFSNNSHGCYLFMENTASVQLLNVSISNSSYHGILIYALDSNNFSYC